MIYLLTIPIHSHTTASRPPFLRRTENVMQRVEQPGAGVKPLLTETMWERARRPWAEGK